MTEVPLDFCSSLSPIPKVPVLMMRTMLVMIPGVEQDRVQVTISVICLNLRFPFIRRCRLRRTSQWNQLRWDYVCFTGQAGGLRPRAV